MAIPKLILRNNPAYKESSLLGYQPLANNKIAPIPFSFTRASAGSVEKKAGIVEMPSDFPRIDKDGSILLEPARTNLFLWSEDFGAATWTKTNSSISTNVTEAPNGVITADKLESSADQTAGVLIRAIGTTSVGLDYTTSLYVKAEEATFIQIAYGSGVVAGNPRANYNLSNGTIETVDAGIEAGIEKLNDGWYRIKATSTAASSTFNVFISIIQSGTDTRTQANTWNSGDGLYIWNAQLEEGSYPTTPIKTEGATATRLVDDVNTTFGTPFAVTTQGTFFYSLKGLESGEGVGVSSPFIRLQQDSDNYAGVSLSSVWRGRFNHLGVGYLNSSPISVLDDVKMILTFSSNGWKMFANGAEFASGTEVFSFTGISDFVNIAVEDRGVQRLREMSLFDVALTDAECINLTK